MRERKIKMTPADVQNFVNEASTQKAAQSEKGCTVFSGVQAKEEI